MRIALTIQYDGTNYSGWQSQNNANSVQREVERAIHEITRENIKIHGAGRTDAGVHAFGQVAHFDTNSSIPAEKFCYALNDKLPADISILKSIGVTDDFHAQYSATGKRYRYVILNSRVRQPLYQNRAMQVCLPLNCNAMRQGAQYLLGEHDFKSFCNTKTDVKSTIRTVERLDIEQKENNIIIDIEGNGFLRNMVRIIAGTLIKCGLGKYKPEHIAEILESKDRKAAGPTAQGCGLYLIQVYYPEFYGI